MAEAISCNKKDIIAIADALRFKLNTASKLSLTQIKNSILSMSNEDNEEESNEQRAQNIVTNKIYSNLQYALNEASEEDTIILLKDIEETNIQVPTNIILDLNGYSLTVSNITSLGQIVDNSEYNTGILYPIKNISLSKNNKQFPIGEEDGSYKFYKVSHLLEKISSITKNEDGTITVKYVYEFRIDTNSYPSIKKGTNISGFSAKVKTCWSKVEKNDIQQHFYTNPDIMSKVFDTWDEENKKHKSVFVQTVTGSTVKKYEHTFSFTINSTTGVEMESPGLSYMYVEEEE